MDSLYDVKGDSLALAEELVKLIEEKTDSTKLYYLFKTAEYYEAHRDTLQATQYYEKLADEAPDDAKVNYFDLLAGYYERIGNKSEAARVLEAAKSLADPSQTAYFIEKIKRITEEEAFEVNFELTKDENELLVFEGNRLVTTFKKYRKGYYSKGDKDINTFFANPQNEQLLAKLNLDSSASRVAFAVIEGEGKSDAFLNWDNAYFSYGIFHWTLGSKKGAGELPAFLKKYKEEEPEDFQKYFGTYGLDVSSDTRGFYGYLTLNGRKINSPALKEQFRNPIWGYRFWKAGQEPNMMAVQIDHAIYRLRSFYWVANKVHGRSVADIITSEYGVALILDYHKHRPGYLYKCLELAMNETGLLEPNRWTDKDELKVINAFLEIRKSYGKSPYSRAEKRELDMKNYLEKGLLSAKRLSFKYRYNN